MVGGPRTFRPEVPFAREKGFVARILHGFRERDFGGPEVAFVFGRKVAVMPAPLAPSFSRGIPNPGGDSMVGGIFAGKNARP